MTDTQPAADPATPEPPPAPWAPKDPVTANALLASRARVLATGKQVAAELDKQVSFYDGALFMLGARVDVDGRLVPAPTMEEAAAALAALQAQGDPHANVDPELAAIAPPVVAGPPADPASFSPADPVDQALADADDATIAAQQVAADTGATEPAPAPAPATEPVGEPVTDELTPPAEPSPQGPGDAVATVPDWLPTPADEPAGDAPPVS